MSAERRFAVVVPTFPGYRHSGAFREVAEAVHGGLRELGHDATMSNTWDRHDRRMIVFGAHLLGLPLSLPRDAILYNLEQVSALGSELVAAMSKYTVWDYSRANVKRWAEQGQAEHVPVGYISALTRIERAAEPELDVLFYGASSPRRRRVIEALEHEGLNVLAFDRLYGEMRDGIMGRSKVILNVSCFDEHRVFEAVRVSYALANELCIVSEAGQDDEEFCDGAIVVPYDELVAACVRAVRDPELRAETARRGYRLMQSRPQREILRKVLS